MKQSFVHLHLHSEFSLSDGIVRLGVAAKRCSDMQLPAVAITDLSNLYGAVKFYSTCLAHGIKPIIGCDVWVECAVAGENANRLTLLCQNIDGYRNLNKILTDAYLQGSVNNKIMIRWQQLVQHNEGLLCLLDEHDGPMAILMTQGLDHEIPERIDRYLELFGDRLYLSVSRIGWADEQAYIEQAIMTSKEKNIGLVATNRVVFLDRDDFEAHEIRVCINDGRVLEDSRRPRKFTDQQYLKSADEMAQLFTDIPIAVSNSLEIAKRCNLFFNFDEDFLPEFADAGGQSESRLLREIAEAGLAERFTLDRSDSKDEPTKLTQEYIDRLHMELDVIEQMGYAGYFLIVADFIKWARENEIPVGPGRGSGVGSLVAWATGITELDPLPYGLIFERFLNPERVSLPDFDIDFCVDGRDRVIEYVAERYGHDQVAQIITFGTMAAKAVVRDVGRVMGFPYGFVDQIAKLVPFAVGMTLDTALQEEQQLRQRYEEEADVQQLIDAALQLEGITRNVGKHAGGVVISPKPLTEFTPLYADTHLNQAITHLDKDDLEKVGLVKFDFLGLKTLTILKSAISMVNSTNPDQTNPTLNLATIALDDEETYKLIGAGKTTAVFQLESRGMKELIFRAPPTKFEDLIALVAMFRPGPLQSGMTEDLVNRKSGKEPVQFLHPKLEPILNTTYGVMLYQEQVMEVAQVLAGYTMGAADLLRKAMGKKQPEEMAKQKEIFTAGAVNHGVDKMLAEKLFLLMEKFAGYGFNKSHSAAYALIAYQTAWMKAHYTAAFMAAALSADLDNTDKVVTLLAECKSLGLTVLPPTVNASFITFMPTSETEISYGLGALKGVGSSVIESIVAEREGAGKYENLFDFCRRSDMKKVNKRVLEALIKSGAMDQLGANRATLMAEVAKATKAADQQQQDRQAGQFDMFGVAHERLEKNDLEAVADWTDEQRLLAEKEALGLYLTGHPYDRYADEFNIISEQDAPNLDLSTPRNGIFAGIMVSMRLMNTRRGKMAAITLDNAIHRVEVSLFSEKLNAYFDKLQKDSVLIAIGELSANEYTEGCQIRAEQILDVEEVRNQALGGLELRLKEDVIDKRTIMSLKKLLSDYAGGKTAVTIRYIRATGESGLLNLGEDWGVDPSQALIQELGGRFGVDNIRYLYDIDILKKSFPSRPAYRPKTAVNH